MFIFKGQKHGWKIQRKKKQMSQIREQTIQKALQEALKLSNGTTPMLQGYNLTLNNYYNLKVKPGSKRAASRNMKINTL